MVRIAQGTASAHFVLQELGYFTLAAFEVSADQGLTQSLQDRLPRRSAYAGRARLAR